MESTHTMLEGETIQGVLSKIWFHSIQFFFFNFSTNQKLWHHLGCRAMSPHILAFWKKTTQGVSHQSWSNLAQWFSRRSKCEITRGQMSGTAESWSKNMKNSNTHFCISVSVVWKRVELQYTKLIPALIPCQWTVLIIHDWSWSTRTQIILCTD